MNKKTRKIYAVIKAIRDSFHESVATYTHGRCYHFACILKEVFGGELYETDNGGHVVCKIDGEFYDIRGNVRFIYKDKKEYKKLSKEQALNWDSNWHSGSVKGFQKYYNKT